MPRSYILLCAWIAVLCAVLLLYSQTMAFAWDEGFHLLCAQLILRGKLPYRDFIFSQTPLNSYWNAGWFRAFGESWRTAHAVAALCTTAAIFLMMDYAYRRFADPKWRPQAALVVSLVLGLNILILYYGTLGQAYGLALLLLVIAFRCAVAQAPFFAGLAVGAAANATLLTAPALPILIIWMAVYRKRRWFLSIPGALLSAVPLALLFAKSPANAWFGIFEYNFLYRGVQWETATSQNISVYLSWVDSAHALMILLLSITGAHFIFRRSGWDRSEYILAGALALGLAAHISTAHPTFERYYLFTIPFLSLFCAAAVYSLGGRRFLFAGIAVLGVMGLVRPIYKDFDGFRWTDFEKISRKVDEVTPPGASLAADEHVYFITKRVPPEGMELMDSHKLEFTAERARQLHLIPLSVLRQKYKSGDFHTVETSWDDEDMTAAGLRERYKNVYEFEAEDCHIFWLK